MDIVFEQLPFNHPLFVSYTSGTTGLPKPIVHGFGGLLSCARNLWLHCNGNRNDVWLSVSPCGWATWHMFSQILAFGQTLVLYDGVPYFLYPTSIWDKIDQHKINCILMRPDVLDDMEKKNFVPGKHNHLKSLKLIIGGGSVVKNRNFDFIYNKVKSDVLFGSTYGCTEFLDIATTLEYTIPLYKGECCTPSFGADIRCYNDEGIAVEGEIGELVVLTPSPSLPVYLWDDVDGQRYKNSYFSKFPEVFSPGDLCIINPVTKGIIIIGRSDDTLNPGGTRFGCTDIYDVVNNFAEVKDSLCVSQYSAQGNERAILFIQMQDIRKFTEDFKQKIRKSIEEELTKRHVPNLILKINGIPRNINGKKMEVIVKKIINKMPYNADSILNKECLSEYYNIPELEAFT